MKTGAWNFLSGLYLGGGNGQAQWLSHPREPAPPPRKAPAKLLKSELLCGVSSAVVNFGWNFLPPLLPLPAEKDPAIPLFSFLRITDRQTYRKLTQIQEPLVKSNTNQHL
eukprot:803035-Amphidinium_carterae.1